MFSANYDLTGLYSVPLNGGDSEPTLLLSFWDLQKNNTNPYFLSFLSVDISPDGRWLCVTVDDQRLRYTDIPLANSNRLQQPDPGSAIDMAGNKWIPCHSVILFDLKNGKIADPFKSEALKPTNVIVTAAAFAPDGRALLCAAFGDGGPWTTESLNTTTLFGINPDNGAFDAERIYIVDAGFQPTQLTWHGNNTIHMRTRYATDTGVHSFVIFPEWKS